MKHIAIFYHCLVYLGNPPELSPNACNIIGQQMYLLSKSGLEDAASQIICGVNGGEESKDIARLLLPTKASIVFHGLQCKNENRTILEIEKWVKTHPDWYVLYFHSKGATKPAGDWFSTTWRECMTRNAITNWKQCVKDLDTGHYDAVGSHWMVPPATPPGQHIFAGSFWWSKSEFLNTLPSIMERDRIKISGIDSIDSRYEAEVWLGNGTRIPRIRDYHPGWNPSKIQTCIV